MNVDRPVARRELSSLIEFNRLIVCVGSGGVGKTTVAAAIGIEAAFRGKRVLVITIDPARRLASALGMDSIGSVESRVPLESLLETDSGKMGALYAMMLDTRTAFDEVINRVSPDERVRDRILNNGVYREVSRAISTSQEYMASEKLYHAYSSGLYDLIVLDTPPMKNALDFLEAPQRLVRFLNERIIGWFIHPFKQKIKFVGKRFVLSTGVMVYRLLGFIFGKDFLSELHEFFLSFEDISSGFRMRSDKVGRILRTHDTAFLVVCDPSMSTLETTRHFIEELEKRKLNQAGLIINQVRTCDAPTFSDNSVLSKSDCAYLDGLDKGWRSLRRSLESNFKIAYQRSIGCEQTIERLTDIQSGRGFIQTVARMSQEITDIPGLLRFNKYLFYSV